MQIWKDFFSQLYNPQEKKIDQTFNEKISKELEKLMKTEQANMILDGKIS